MVASVPPALKARYAQWADKVPRQVLTDLTEDQLSGRLHRAQQRWTSEFSDGGGKNTTAALADATAILSEPAPQQQPAPVSVLKTLGITAAMIEANPLIGQIPEAVLAKMDAPSIIKRAQVAAEVTHVAGRAAARRVLEAAPYVTHTSPLDTFAAAAVRRGVREDLARAHGRWIADIPDDLLGKLDAAEVADRCDYAQELYRRGMALPTPGAVHGYLDRARKHLTAEPRADVQAQAQQLEKAALVANDRTTARTYTERAKQLRSDHPAVPAKPRPGLLGKAVVPADPPPAGVLNKATMKAATRPHTATSGARKAGRRPRLEKTEAVRLGEGLDLLTTALHELRDRPLNKGDDWDQLESRIGVTDLLGRSKEAIGEARLLGKANSTPVTRAELMAMVRQAVAKATTGQAPHPRGQSTGSS